MAWKWVFPITSIFCIFTHYPNFIHDPYSVWKRPLDWTINFKLDPYFQSFPAKFVRTHRNLLSQCQNSPNMAWAILSYGPYFTVNYSPIYVINSQKYTPRYLNHDHCDYSDGSKNWWVETEQRFIHVWWWQNIVWHVAFWLFRPTDVSNK